MVDHSLRIARGAGGVVERDRVPLVVRHRPVVVGIAGSQEGLVIGPAEGGAIAGEFRIVVIDDERRHLGLLERAAGELREFTIDDEDFGLAVVEAEAEGLGIEAGVERVEHRARHRHAVMALDHRGRVGEQHRHGVAPADAAGLERRREAPAARVEIGIGTAQRPVDHRNAVRKGPGGPVEIGQRRQRLIISRIPIEIPVIDRLARHRRRLPFQETLAEPSARSTTEKAPRGLDPGAFHGSSWIVGWSAVGRSGGPPDQRSRPLRSFSRAARPLRSAASSVVCTRSAR